MSAAPLPPDHDPVGRALAYPFARPAGSFVFDAARETVTAATFVGTTAKKMVETDGLEVPLVSAVVEVEGGTVEFADRVPVLASGSNAAPSQLARKYRAHPEFPPILVHEVKVEGLASVYSAHVARYGSVAATLVPCPSFTARLHLLFVPPQALAHLNRTESLGGNYLLAELARDEMDLGGGTAIAPLSYISRRGPARFDGVPRRLPDTGSGAGAFAVATQAEIQRLLQALVGDVGNLEDFVRRLIGDDAFRAAATDRLAATTARILPEGARILAGA